MTALFSNMAGPPLKVLLRETAPPIAQNDLERMLGLHG